MRKEGEGGGEVKASGKAARELGKKTFTLPRGVFGHHLPFSFLPASQPITPGALNIYIDYYIPHLYCAQIVQLPPSALRTPWLAQPHMNATTPWLLTG